MEPVLRLHVTPLIFYALRCYAPALLYMCLGFLAPAAFVPNIDTASTWILAVCGLSALMGANLPWLLVARFRPYVIADKRGVRIVVHDFLQTTYAKWLYAFKGYGTDYLPMVIDYVQPFALSWAEIKHFTIAKSPFIYRVRMISRNRKGYTVYSSHKREDALAVRRKFEVLRKTHC